MKKRICVLLLLVFSLVGLASCGDPYSKVSMTITGDGLNEQNEITLALQEDVGGALSPKNSVRLSVEVNAPSSLSEDIVLPTFGDRYGDEYVEIELVKEKGGSYSLVFKGVKSGETNIPIKTKDGNITQVIRVKVQLGVTKIEFKENSQLLVKPGDSVDLSALNRKYISYTPATTEQTDVIYKIPDNQIQKIKEYIDARKITLDNNVLKIDGSVSASGDETIKVIAISTQKSASNEEISTGTNRFLEVKIINAYDFNSLNASIENKAITPKGTSNSGNSINYELVLANPIVPSGESLGNETGYIFGGELVFINNNSEYKIFLSDINSDIVSINSSGVDYDANNKTNNYKYQIMPKDLGTETFTFKICYVGEKDTGEYDDNFTKYIHLTVTVKDLPTQSNLLLNNTNFANFGKLMVFETYSNGGGAKLTIYDPKALDMTFEISYQGLVVYSDEKCTNQVDSYIGNNGDSIYVKAGDGLADPQITITMSSKFFAEYKNNSNIADGITYSKNVVVEAYIIQDNSSFEFVGANGVVIEIKIDGNTKLSPQLIACYNDASVDMRQVVTSYSSSNLRSGSISFGTGDDKNKIYFTPNFKLQYDSYVSDTDLTFLLQNGTKKTITIDVKFNYIEDENKKPILWFDLDTTNPGYLASWNGEDCLDPQADFSKIPLSNQGTHTIEGANTYYFTQFNYLILATNSTIKFNVYRLCLYDGAIIKVSSNDNIQFSIDTTANASVRWQNLSGDGIIRTGDAVSTFNNNACNYTVIDIKLSDSTETIMTLKVAVFDKISSVGLKQNSFSLFDGANLKIADIDNCFAEIELDVKSVSNNGNVTDNSAYGNLYSNFSLVDPDEVLFNISSGASTITREKYELVDGADKSGDILPTYTTVNKKLEKVTYNGDVYYKIDENWYDTIVKAYEGQDPISDNNLKEELNKIKNTIEVVVFKFISKSGGQDIVKILSNTYKNGYIDLMFEGSVNQFNNSFANCNFTVRLYNPSKVSSIKTSVNKEMGLYYEVGNSKKQNSNKFSYNILPSSAFNTNVFVQITEKVGNGSIKPINFQLSENNKVVEKGVFDTPKNYLNGIESTSGFEYYYTNDYGQEWYKGYNDLTDELDDEENDAAKIAVLKTLNKTQISQTVQRVCYTDFIVIVKPSSSTIEIIYNGTNPGNFTCSVIALDSVGEGSDYIESKFDIYVADGSANYKYQIRNRADFNSFLDKTNTNTGDSKYYVLATDIILTNSLKNEGYTLNDNLSGMFETGNYDVNGDPVTYKYSIYGLSIESTTVLNVGLFASIGKDGLRLDYLNIENAYVLANITSESELNVGMLFGKIDKQININNCKVSGSIEINANDEDNCVNVGGFAGKIDNENAVIKGVPSENSINNSDINSNISIVVNRRYLENNNQNGETHAGGIAGLLENGSLEEVNVISQIKVVKQQYTDDGGVKTIKAEDFDSLAETGGVVGHIKNALVKQVVVYPVVAGYKRVGGLAGFVEGGEFKNSQVQLLYNINMRNVIAGYSEVGGLFGAMKLSKDLSIDFCYVRSYSNKEVNRYDCKALDIYDEIKSVYYGGIVLINNNSFSGAQTLGGFVGKATKETGVAKTTIKFTNSYLYTDISSSATTEREKVAGFIGTLSGPIINAIDCYIDCDININGTFRVSYSDVNVSSNTTLYGNESSHAYKTFGDTELSKKGDYSIIRETITSKLVNTTTEAFSSGGNGNVNDYSQFQNVYVKIGDDQFGITGTSNKNEFKYSTLSTKITEIHILLLRGEDNEYYISSHKSGSDGSINEYFELAVDEDASTVLKSVTKDGINDIMGYGFMTNKQLFAKKYTCTEAIKTSDSDNWIKALQDITKSTKTTFDELVTTAKPEIKVGSKTYSIYRNGGMQFVNDGTDWYSCINSVMYSGEQSSVTAIGVINTQNGAYQYGTARVGNDTIYCVKVGEGWYKITEITCPYKVDSSVVYGDSVTYIQKYSAEFDFKADLNGRYTYFEVKVGNNTYYINESNTAALLNNNGQNSEEIKLDYPWVFKNPEKKYFDLSTAGDDFIPSVDIEPSEKSLEEIDEINGETVTKMVWYETKYDSKSFLSYGWMLVYVNDENLAYIINGVYAVSKNSVDGFDSAIKVKSNELFFFNAASINGPYYIDGEQTITVNGQDPNAKKKLSYYEGKGEFIVVTDWASGEITIDGSKYTLEDGVLKDENEVEIPLSNFENGVVYITRQITIGETQNKLDANKYVKIYNSLYNKACSSVEEMYEDSGFNSFDGEIKKLFGEIETYYVVRTRDTNNNSYTDEYYKTIECKDLVTDSTLIETLNGDKTAIFGGSYYVSYDNETYYYSDGTNWYETLSGERYYYVSDSNSFTTTTTTNYINSFSGIERGSMEYGTYSVVSSPEDKKTINVVLKGSEWKYDGSAITDSYLIDYFDSNRYSADTFTANKSSKDWYTTITLDGKVEDGTLITALNGLDKTTLITLNGTIYSSVTNENVVYYTDGTDWYTTLAGKVTDSALIKALNEKYANDKSQSTTQEITIYKQVKWYKDDAYSSPVSDSNVVKELSGHEGQITLTRFYYLKDGVWYSDSGCKYQVGESDVVDELEKLDKVENGGSCYVEYTHVYYGKVIFSTVINALDEDIITEDIDFTGKDIVSSYDLTLYLAPEKDRNGNDIWTYDNKYQHVVEDENILELSSNKSQNNIVFKFEYDGTAFDVTVSDKGAINIVNRENLGNLTSGNEPYIEDEKIYITRDKTGGENETTSYVLSSGDSAYKWIISDKVNGGMPTIVKTYINEVGENEYEQGYMLWFDTLANLTLSVNEFVKNGSNEYYVIDSSDGKQHQGHIANGSNSVILMYNESVDGTQTDSTINKYSLSYGVTESGYFIATINGKVMELTGVKIDKESASQIVVLSSDSSIVSVSSSNVYDNYITLTVNQLGSTDITFYNLKDDGISVSLHIDVVRGFTGFVVESDNGVKVDSEIDLNIDEYAFYKFGYENVLNGKAYIANSSGYRVTVESIDNSQIGDNDSSSILFAGQLIDGESIGKIYDFDYSNSAGLLALNKKENGGKIVLKLSPYVLVNGNKIVVEGCEKTITINVSSAANLVEFTENHTTLMAGDTKEITLVVLSNNKENKQTINLSISGGDIKGTITALLDPSGSRPVVLSNSNLLNIKLKDYRFEESVSVSGNAIINRHYFILVVGLNKEYYLEKYDTGISPFSTYLEYQLKAEDVVSSGKNSTFDLTLAPNEINRIDSYFYPSLELGSDGEFKQVSVKAVAEGQTGIYKIGLSPEYNNVLAVDVIFDNRYADLIEVAQVKPNTIDKDNNSIEFVELGDSKPNTYIGNVLTLWNELIDYNALNSENANVDNDYSKYYLYTQGEYFIRIKFKEGIPENIDFAIDIVAYDYSRNVIMTKSDSVLIDPKPVLNVLSDGLNRGVVAKGEYLPFVINAQNVTSNILLDISNQDGSSISSFTLTGNVYSLSDKGKYSLVTNISRMEAGKTYYLDTSNLGYGVYRLKVSGEKSINYVTYVANSELTFTVAEFTLEGISEKEANDGVITIKNGNYKVLTAKLKVNDKASNLGKDDPITMAIESLKTTISGFNDEEVSNWYINNGSGWDRIALGSGESKKQFNTFVVSQESEEIEGLDGSEETWNKVVLRARSLGSVSLRLSVHYYYTNEGKIGIDWTNNLYHTDGDNTYLVDILEYNFTFTVKDNSTEDHPNPLYNQTDLQQLSVADGNYILYDDIELIDWKPIDFKALYLDGNGFTIKIKSFDLSDEKGSQEAYAGIFRTISENSTIKNLNIDVYPLLKSTSEANSMLNGNKTPNIDLRETEQVTFGILAGENMGVVENVKVVNCSLEEKVLYVSTTRGYYQVGDDYNSVSATIGGLVGVNSGVIADSMVGVRSGKTIQISRRGDENSTQISVSSISISAFSIWGGNNIAGFVVSNGGTISNCFVSDLSINNITRVSEGAMTSGFVGNNTGKIYSCACTSTQLVGFRANTTIKGSTTTAGFVHTNAQNGTVEDCYTNVGIANNNIATAGFVYENLGSIVNAYTTSKNTVITNNSYSSSHGLFVYVKPMSGTIKNCYYAIVDDEYGLGKEIDTELLKTLDPAIGINISTGDIPVTGMFDGFTFATSSDTLDGVWYISNGKMPTLINCEDIEIYTARTLVSAPAAYFTIEDEKVKQYDLSKILGDEIDLNNNTFKYGGIKFIYNENNNNIITYKDVDGVEKTITKGADNYYYYPGGSGDETQYQYEYTRNNPGTLYNPLLVSSAEEFNKYIVTNTQKYETKDASGNVTKTEYIFGGKSAKSDSDSTIAKYVKVIQDLDFSDKTILTKHEINNGSEKISIADVVFNGTLIGNSMTLSNIYLVNENKSTSTNWGIFSQIGLDESGESGAFVFNLKLNYREVSSENSERVGVLAGTIINSTIAKIEITGPGQNNDKDAVRGKYFVGGLAGYIGEGAKISEISASDINVSAGYVTVTDSDSFTLTSAYSPNDTTYSKFTYRDENKSDHNLELTEAGLTGNGNVTSLTNISYAGAIAGVVEGVTPSAILEINDKWNIYKTSDADPTYKTVRKASDIYNISVGGNVNISGMIAGGLFGYAGQKGSGNKQLILKDLYFELDKTADQNIYGRAYSGGLVGYLYNSAIVEGRVEHEESVQDEIDKNINSISASNISNNNLFANTLSGSTVQNIAIGGLVGYSNDGIIVDSYSKVNVVNTSSLIAGGLVGQADNKLYIAFSYTTGNVDASLMVGGLIGYKLFDNNTNDLYLYNVIASNIWDSSIFNTITSNAKYFVDNVDYSSTLQEIGNFSIGFKDNVSSSEPFKYLGSLIGRVSVIADSEKPNDITKNSAMSIVETTRKTITRTETIAGAGAQDDEEEYITYYNNNYFNVISSTYGKVKHSGSMNLDNYTSIIDGDKLTQSTTMIGNQYYISFITGDFINNYKIGDYNSEYKNEFSSSIGFVYDNSNLAQSDYKSDYSDITPNAVSTVWYVESNTYLPKHGYNYNSNTEEIYTEDELKTALTYGYSDKVYRLNGLDNEVKDATKVFDSYTLNKESGKEINLSNCTFIYTPTASGTLKPANKFTLTINLSDYEMYNVLNGCTFENFKFVITCSADTLKSFNTSGYSGLFANEMSGCTFINCEFEFVPATVTLDSESKSDITSFGVLTGRANRLVMSNCNITLPSNLTINANNEVKFANVGAVFGVLRNSTLSGITTNDVIVTFNIKTQNSSLFVGGIAGLLDGTAITNLTSNLTVNTAIQTTATIKNTNGGLAIGGLFGYSNTSTLDTITSTTILSSNTFTLGAKAETIMLGGLVGRESSSILKNIALNSTISYTYGGGEIERLNIGGLVGLSDGSSMETVAVTGALTYKAGADNSNLKNVNIGGVIAESAIDTLNGIENGLAITVDPKVYYNNVCSNMLMVGGLIGISSGDTNTITNSYNFADITINDLMANKSYIGGIIGYSKKVNMTNVISYGDIIHKDNESLKQYRFGNNTYYIDASGTIYLEANKNDKLVDTLDKQRKTDLKDNTGNTLGCSVTYNGYNFYYKNSDNAWYTSYNEKTNEFSNPLSAWKDSAIGLKNNHITFGGIIGYAHSNASASTFTNVLSMTNFISSDKNNDNKVLASVHGFAYNLSLKSTSDTQTITNSYFIAEFDPAGASENAWAGYALPYAEIKKFISNSSGEMVANNGSDYFPLISGASSQITDGTITNANITADDKKLNPEKKLPTNNVVTRTYYIYLDEDNAETTPTKASWSGTINIGLGAVVTTRLTAGNTYFQVSANPIGTNNGVISNFLFDYVGANSSRGVESTEKTFLGMGTNNGYILNCLFATYQYEVTKDQITYKTSGIKLNTPNNSGENSKVSIININNGGIYKTGSAIKFIEGSTVYENQSLSFMTIENNGTIKESYTISSFDGSTKGKSVNVDYGALAVTNNGLIEHCLVGGQVAGSYNKDSSKVAKFNKGTIKNMVYSKTGSYTDIRSTEFSSYSNIWNVNGSDSVNDGYPYIKNGKSLGYSDFGAEKVNIYSVQTLKNFLNYLNAFDEKTGGIKSIQNYQTVTFKITSGGSIDKEFTLNNEGTIKGEIKDLTIKNSLVTENKGTMQDLTLNNINVVNTSNNISQVGLLCKTNNGSIENITATGCSVGTTKNKVKGGSIIAYENKSGKTISGVTISGCKLYGTTQSYTDTSANLGLVAAINNGSIDGDIIIKSSTISGSGHFVGLLVGNNQNSVGSNTIKLDDSTITVGAQRVGGLIGNNATMFGYDTTITLDSVYVEINNDTNQKITSLYVGGVFGWTRYLTAKKITSSGTITISSVNSETTINLGGVIGRLSTENNFGKTVDAEIDCSNSIVATAKKAESYNYSIGGIVGHCKSDVALNRKVAFAGNINCSKYLDKELCGKEDGIYTVVHEDIKYLTVKDMFSQVNVAQEDFHHIDIQQFCMFSYNDMSLGWFSGSSLKSDQLDNFGTTITSGGNNQQATCSAAIDKVVAIHLREKMNEGWNSGDFVRFEAYEYYFNKSKYMSNGGHAGADWQIQGTRSCFEQTYSGYIKSKYNLEFNQNNLNNMWAWWVDGDLNNNYYNIDYYAVLQYGLEDGYKLSFKGFNYIISSASNASYLFQPATNVSKTYGAPFNKTLQYYSMFYNNFIYNSRHKNNWDTYIYGIMDYMAEVHYPEVPFYINDISEKIQPKGINAWTPFHDMEKRGDGLTSYVIKNNIAGVVTLYY